MCGSGKREEIWDQSMWSYSSHHKWLNVCVNISLWHTLTPPLTFDHVTLTYPANYVADLTRQTCIFNKHNVKHNWSGRIWGAETQSESAFLVLKMWSNIHIHLLKTSLKHLLIHIFGKLMLHEGCCYILAHNCHGLTLTENTLCF